MKQIFLSVTLAFAVLASAHAQSYRFYNQWGQATGSARPNYSGGYNFYNQWGQQTGSARPNYSGGYNFHNQWGQQTGSQRSSPW